MVGSSKSSWWLDSCAFLKGECWDQQETVISECGWHSAILPCTACCLGCRFLGGWTTKMTSRESLIDLLQECKCTVSGNCVSQILAQEAAERNFFTAKMHYFLLMHSSPRLDFGKAKIKHSWIPEQWAKVDSRRILHFHCNLAILDLGLNTLGTVPYVLIRFSLICSSSRMGRIPTVGACLPPEWSLLHFRKWTNCGFNSKDNACVAELVSVQQCWALALFCLRWLNHSCSTFSS